MSHSDCYPEKSPKIDALCDTLSHNIRREIIHYFETVSDSSSATLDTIASHIETRVPAVTREEVKICLVHTHLPKLRSRGWLEYDARSGYIHYIGHESAKQLITEVAETFDE